MRVCDVKWTFGNELTELTPQLPSTAISDRIRSKSKKKNMKRKRMMGWIENGPLKKLRQFFVHQQLPAKTEMCPFWSISLRFTCGDTLLRGTC
jgi:hypothetical protein